MSGPSLARVSEWTVEEVAEWLKSDSVGLGAAVTIWAQKGINGAGLLALDRRQLDSLGHSPLVVFLAPRSYFVSLCLQDNPDLF